jgi:hypothetical protein
MEFRKKDHEYCQQFPSSKVEFFLTHYKYNIEFFLGGEISILDPKESIKVIDSGYLWKATVLQFRSRYRKCIKIFLSGGYYGKSEREVYYISLQFNGGLP